MSQGITNTRESVLKKKSPPSLDQSKKVIVLKLISTDKSKKEKIFKIHKDRIIIGSVESADVKLKGGGIAPIHAVLEVTPNSSMSSLQGVVFDLASQTGVFVNDKKVVAQPLDDKDQIRVGDYTFVFSLQDLNTASQKEVTREIDGRTLFLNKDEDLAPLNLEDEREVIEIFDFTPTSQRALEIVMSWCGIILNIEHFIKEKKVTIGSTRKSDFGIPSVLSSSQYTIVTQSRDGFILNLDSKMTGVMQKEGQLKDFEEIRSSLVSGPHGHEIAIGQKDFAKISIGDIDFYLSYTAAPPRLKRKKILERDPFFQKIFSFSMILTVLALIILSKTKFKQNAEMEQVPERIATILYQPEKFLTPPPIPPKKEVEKPKPIEKITITPQELTETKPLPKVMAVKKEIPQKASAKPVENIPKSVPKNKPAAKGAAKEGEGAKAKGVEGSRGEKDKPKTTQKVTQLSRPSPKTGASGASGESQVSQEGNVDILKGAGGKIQNILGNSAAHLGEGSENLKGFGTFSTGGNGGLGLSGSGHGGGGDAETSLGGLGKKGTGMGRVGTGQGAAGMGVGIVGSQVRVAIRSEAPEETIVMGAIDRNAVAEAIYAHKDEFRLCYEREINAESPHLSGQIGTSFVIGSSGRVTQAGIESSSLNNPNAERCVLAVLKRIDFPAPKGGGVVEVHFPFKFSAGGRS